MASGNPENPGFGQVTDHPSRVGSGCVIRGWLRLSEPRRLVPIPACTGDPIQRFGFRKSGKSWKLATFARSQITRRASDLGL
ncbi:hypothetical protein DdX_04274 [Ditylenchus destructor]|uniref:Uncharacterized protein n=1 Tax=Ditylenchus destructor TaxID=166010 RepID=A0AAD4R7L7_9BILA|nr:hypothetical protein DdX_04274 [Ditylenchus destructor]